MLGQPDLVFILEGTPSCAYVVEFTNGKKNSRANGQLKKEGNYFQSLGYEVALLRVKYRRGNYRINNVFLEGENQELIS